MLTRLFITTLLLVHLSAEGQRPPFINYYAVNEDRPGAVYSFSFVHLTDTHVGEGAPGGDYGSPGVDDEMPIGDVGDPAMRLRRTVDWINANYLEKGIEFVVVSGDMTDSGERSEFLKFKEIMDALTIPYVPLIGNHDVWPYVDGFVADRPNGDSLINIIFEEVYDDARLFFDDWDDGTRLSYTWNPEAETFNYLQNFQATYKGFHFLFMDYDPRYPAARNEPGIGPEAEIMDFDGGSWPWVREKIIDLDQEAQLGDQNVFLISHHPPLKEFWSWYYAFDLNEKEVMMDFLFNYKQHLALWLAGHIHRNTIYQVNTTDFQPYNVVECAETKANKDFEQGVFRVVDVYDSGIPTDVTQNMISMQVDVYPNPGDGNFKIFLKGNHDKNITTVLYDPMGRVVSFERLSMDTASRLFELNAAGSPPGIYHLRLNNSKRSLTLNLMIQ